VRDACISQNFVHGIALREEAWRAGLGVFGGLRVAVSHTLTAKNAVRMGRPATDEPRTLAIGLACGYCTDSGNRPHEGSKE
jgi:hypothetical protein